MPERKENLLQIDVPMKQVDYFDITRNALRTKNFFLSTTWQCFVCGLLLFLPWGLACSMLMTAEFSTHLAFKFLPTLLLRIDPACYCALPSGTQHTAHHREESIRYFQCVLTAKTACQLIFILSYLFLLRLSLLHNSFPYLSSLFLMQSREDINEKKGIRFTPLPKSCFPVL